MGGTMTAHQRFSIYFQLWLFCRSGSGSRGRFGSADLGTPGSDCGRPCGNNSDDIHRNFQNLTDIDQIGVLQFVCCHDLIWITVKLSGDFSNGISWFDTVFHQRSRFDILRNRRIGRQYCAGLRDQDLVTHTDIAVGSERGIQQYQGFNHRPELIRDLLTVIAFHNGVLKRSTGSGCLCG